MFTKSKIILSCLALGLAAVPAAAQQVGGGIAVGAAIKDTSGGAVGTVSKVDGEFVIVKTDKHEVRVPASSFTPTADGLLFGLTRDQLNAQVDQALAAANAKLVVGAAVTGSGGANAGTIEAIDDQYVTLKLPSGAAVRLPRAAVAAGPNGVVTSLTAAELEAAAKPAAEAAAATPK
jgi:preprotein translocase subunit YajC